MCQKNGWMQLQTGTGSRFQSEEACVSYASKGGTLFAVPTVTVVSAACTSGSLFSVEEILFSAAGFTPNSALTANIVSDDSAGATTTVSYPPAFDSSGSATGSADAAFVPPQTTFSGFVVIADGSGMSATTPNITSPCVAS
jgi:hypothetical protein